MDFETILLEVGDGIATLTLNRPDRLNAYVVRMGEELVEAFGRAREDASVRAVVWTGAGRAFCSGVDLDALRAQAASAAPGPRLGEEAFVRSFPLELAAFPKPVVAAIHGAAIGVGVTMTLPCDARIAAEGAKLGLPFAKLGMLPGLGSTHLLPRLVGTATALELVLTGRTIPAAEAARIGLVNRVVPAEALLDEARALAGEMGACAPEVLAAAKRAIHFGAAHDMQAAMRNEAAEGAALRAKRALP
jgi:enoyl-CoA hydratase/carnithine racemase